MAEWKTAALSGMFPADVQDAIAEATAAAATTNSVLSPVRDALNLAKNVLIGLPVLDIPALLAQIIEDFLNDFRASGIYYLPVLDRGLEDVVKLNLNFKSSARVWEELNVPSYDSFGSNDDTYAQDRNKKAFQAYFFRRYLGGPTGSAMSRFKNRVVQSFSDVGDDNRPVFTGEVSGTVFLVGAPSLAEYVDVLVQIADLWPSNLELEQVVGVVRNNLTEGFLNTFNHSGNRIVRRLEGDNTSGYSLNFGREVKPYSITIRQLSEIEGTTAVLRDFFALPAERIAGDKPVDETTGGFDARSGWTISTPATIDYSTGEFSGLKFSSDPGELVVSFIPTVRGTTPPDWTTINLDKLFPFIFGIMDNYMLPIVQALRAGANAQDAMIALINLLDAKLVKLDALITEAERLVDIFGVILGATGVYSLYVHSSTGITGWIEEFQNATNEPPFNAFDAFVGGIVLMAGGPSLGPFDNFFEALA